MTTTSKAFFDKTSHLVTSGNIVYASDLNDPLTAIETGQTALVNALQTGATIFTANDTGVVNAYVINPTAALTAYSDGQTVWLKPGLTNTGASTINVSSLGVKSIRSTVSTALTGGELIAGYWHMLKYSSTLDAFVIASERGRTDTELTKTIAGGTGIAVSTVDNVITVAIAAGGVGADQLDDDAVTEDKVADDAITTDKIANGSVTQEKIASLPDIVSRDIIGGDVTTSGQIITVSAFGCWDSTGTVWLETSTNKTWEVPATNNLEVYLFAVRSRDDGTISVKGYDTYAGPDSDTVLFNAYRFLSWSKNNGSGALNLYVQKGDALEFTGSGVQLTASVTASWVGYVVASVIPVSLVQTMRVIVASAIQLEISYDGTTPVSPYVQNFYSPTEVMAVSPLYLRAAGSAEVSIRGMRLIR